MTRKRSLSDDERVLWETVTRSIAPLRIRRVKRVELELSEKKSPPPSAHAKPRVVHRPSVAPATALRPAPPPLAPMDRRTKQRLARGTTEIGGRLDLHGLTQAQAHPALASFLHAAQARDVKVVLVITGKGGSSSEGRGVLNRQVPMWLESGELRPFVIGFESAGVGHGGAGALYVRVRRGR
jgi:DNA-nicking Smr family endonuclease